MDNVDPHAPPVAYPELTPVDGRIGPQPEDFLVDELPLYAASGKGEHQYVRARKRLLTTPELARRLARACGVHEREVGYAGLKDKHAVTTQWLSLSTKTPISSQLDLGPGAEILSVTRHDNKLRTGHLLANRFAITLIGVAEDSLAKARAIVSRLKEDGLPNYFGAQRFGRGGRNLNDALQWLARGGRSRNRFEQKLLPSVLQSEIFNRYVSARLSLDPRRLLAGEIVRLEGAGAMFRVDEVEREQPRLDSRDLHLTGPIWGPKMRPAGAAALALEHEICATLGLDEQALGLLGKLVPGTRRDLFAPLTELTLESVDREGTPALRLSFTLPAGSYATEVIRQLTHSPFLQAFADEGVAASDSTLDA